MTATPLKCMQQQKGDHAARCMVMKPSILIPEGRLHRQSSSLKISCRILRDMKVEAIESFQNIVGITAKFFRGLQLLCQFLKKLFICKEV
jgi:hypothetical protein